MLVRTLGSFLGEIWNWPQHMRARRGWRQKQTTPDWQEPGTIRQTNYLQALVATRLVDLCTPNQNLKVYIAALMGFSHICCPNGPNNILFFQGYILGIASTMGIMSRVHIPRTGEGMRSLQMPLSSSRVCRQDLSMTLSNRILLIMITLGYWEE